MGERAALSLPHFILERVKQPGWVLAGKLGLNGGVMGVSYYGYGAASPVALLSWALKHKIMDKQQWLKQAGRITMSFCQKYIMSCSLF